jgi:protein phosphatase PTC2/3
MTAKDLSRDHKPDDADEMARIKQWGGFVSPAPDPGLSARVYLDAEFTMIGLAMSRSIGGCFLSFVLSYLFSVGY